MDIDNICKIPSLFSYIKKITLSEKVLSYTKKIFILDRKLDVFPKSRDFLKIKMLPINRDDSRLDLCNWSITDILSVLQLKNQYKRIPPGDRFKDISRIRYIGHRIYHTGYIVGDTQPSILA